MYVPYRKAYISGMNPLSFVTAFTFGELGSVLALVWWLDGGTHSTAFHFSEFRGILFWLFLGGFVWVIGDLFQQFTAKYLGIGRGIPLSNTNQLWGLAWGALVFGELAGTDLPHKLMVLGGSVIMILGALAISTAVAGEREHLSRNLAVERECDRYGLDYGAVLAAQSRQRVRCRRAPPLVGLGHCRRRRRGVPLAGRPGPRARDCDETRLAARARCSPRCQFDLLRHAFAPADRLLLIHPVPLTRCPEALAPPFATYLF